MMSCLVEGLLLLLIIVTLPISVPVLIVMGLMKMGKKGDFEP